MNSHLSVGDRWPTISVHFDQSITPNQIAPIINFSCPTVFNILQLFHETKNVTEHEGRGHTLLNNRRRIQDSITIDSIDRKFYALSMIQFLLYNVFLSG